MTSISSCLFVLLNDINILIIVYNGIRVGQIDRWARRQRRREAERVVSQKANRMSKWTGRQTDGQTDTD